MAAHDDARGVTTHPEPQCGSRGPTAPHAYPGRDGEIADAMAATAALLARSHSVGRLDTRRTALLHKRFRAAVALARHDAEAAAGALARIEAELRSGALGPPGADPDPFCR